ncbi:MAG: SDR family NAD(P)-dependent oxidoreductase, partial [Pseudonocardia sp.]|nr:SDR family NAD(P)-dependent oxidoreductase [Pseudonocardia sp.]
MTSPVDPVTRSTVRTWFITGATSGIGQALATAALKRGHNVTLVARRTDQFSDLAVEHAERALVINADVRSEESVRAAVQRTLDRFGRIDVVANNAGFGLFGAVEEATDAQARAIFDTNVFGVLNVLRATLPVLRAQRSGHVLQGSSYYGQTAHPGVGMLAATK